MDPVTIAAIIGAVGTVAGSAVAKPPTATSTTTVPTLDGSGWIVATGGSQQDAAVSQQGKQSPAAQAAAGLSEFLPLIIVAMVGAVLWRKASR